LLNHGRTFKIDLWRLPLCPPTVLIFLKPNPAQNATDMTNVSSRDLIPATTAVLQQKRHVYIKRKKIEKLKLVEAYFFAFALGSAFAFLFLDRLHWRIYSRR